MPETALLAAVEALDRALPAELVTLERPCCALLAASDAPSLALLAPEDAALEAASVVEAVRLCIANLDCLAAKRGRREGSMAREWWMADAASMAADGC
jgi:hypothetical protein